MTDKKESIGSRLHERVIKNVMTSIFGLIIVVFCGVLMYMEKADYLQLSGFMLMGIHWMGLKDTAIGIKSK